jgi:hypothetical protein
MILIYLYASLLLILKLSGNNILKQILSLIYGILIINNSRVQVLTILSFCNEAMLSNFLIFICCFIALEKVFPSTTTLDFPVLLYGKLSSVL